MFFSDRIKSIKSSDKVLEIGPGATPYFRSDVFLELKYNTEKERIAQSGRVGILKTEKEVVYYDGGKFPFSDKEFDYIVCSHVLEHVSDADFFLSEIQRVGKRGYIEYPTVYYDYIYNFKEHQLFLLKKDGIINWMTKEESGLDKFSSIHNFFFKTCELGYFELIDDFKEYFFQGFEWFDLIYSKRVEHLEDITYTTSDIFLDFNKINSDEEQKLYRTISFKKFLKYKLKRFFNLQLR